MTQLGEIRHQLSVLRWWRFIVRGTTAYAALITAILWALVAIFFFDLLFFKALGIALDPLQRIVLLMLATATCVLAFFRFTRPLLSVRETDMDMALLVEQQHGINSDLVAALQFESPDAVNWGSQQLEYRVIDSAERLGRGLDVFEGFSKDQIVRRGTVLGVTVVMLLGLCGMFPDYFGAFMNRLALGSRHYPTRVKIEQVLVNDNAVLQRGDRTYKPRSTKVAQGQSVVFAIQTRGRAKGLNKVSLVSTNESEKRRTEVLLNKINSDARLARLREAETSVNEALDEAAFHASQAWIKQVTSLLQFDAPKCVELINAYDTEEDREQLHQVVDELQSSIKNWSDDKLLGDVYVGQLDRMMDPVRYVVHVGDAWTDESDISMTPLPLVEPRLKVTPPGYAKAGWKPPADPAVRQLSVLEGSNVEVAIQCTNGKSLAEAWMIATVGDESKRFNFTKSNDKGTTWSIDIRGTPFYRIKQQVRYAIHATDKDGLSIPAPIDGFVRIKVDHGPIGTAAIVRDIYRANAAPVIDFSINDDYGISKMLLHAKVERSQNDLDLTSPKLVEKIAPQVILDKPILPRKLPHPGKYQLTISSLQVNTESGESMPLELDKGDRLKLTFEIVDYRGKLPGKSYFVEPLFINIADVSDVLATSAEDDQRAVSDIDKIQNKLFED